MPAEATLQQDGDVFVLTLRRPAHGNALSASLVEALHERLDELERADPGVLVVEGEGRNFCTGFDLRDVASLSDADLMLRFVRVEQLLARLWSAPWPTIAVARGRALGAGADLLVSCARRIVSHDATFAFPGAAFGLVLGARRLKERVGCETALQWIGGPTIDATQAAFRGLASTVVNGGDVDACLAEEVARVTQLDAVTRSQLRAAIGLSEGLDADLAALVRSAARPGLRDRVVRYRAESLARRAATSPPLPQPEHPGGLQNERLGRSSGRKDDDLHDLSAGTAERAQQ